MNVAATAREIESEPIALDPRPCGFCGRTIDQHECFDEGDGPEFFCWDEDDVVKVWELADPRDRWRHTGETPPPASVRNSDITPSRPSAPAHYRTPQATCDAFLFVVNLCDPARLKAWLADHPRDARHLLKHLENK
jgi:hypothetical protein